MLAVAMKGADPNLRRCRRLQRKKNNSGANLVLVNLERKSWLARNLDDVLNAGVKKEFGSRGEGSGSLNVSEAAGGNGRQPEEVLRQNKTD